MKLYALYTENGYDQTCETYEDKCRESDDLRELGCRVKCYTFDSWEDHDAYVYKDSV